MNATRFKAVVVVLAALASTAFTAAAIGKNPFSVTGSRTISPDGQALLSLSFTVPPLHYIYADLVSARDADGKDLQPKTKPEPYKKHDQFSNAVREIYTNSFTITYVIDPPPEQPMTFTVSYQGCSDKLCFFPVTTNITVSPENTAVARADKPSDAGLIATARAPAASAADWKQLATGFKVAGKKEGYIRSDEFIRFLDDSGKGNNKDNDKIRDMFQKRGGWALLAVLFILIGGLGLNLTPCILPMIPINIAIIGAGAGAGSKARGLALGGIYGAAIAFTYGLLGLFVVLTGSRFGALNSSYIFNAAIAAVFIFLALAMFDIFTLDFSRFQSNTSTGHGKKGSMFTAFFMGTVSALLAGACVAPVVVTVLLLSTDLYKRGEVIGIFLPFILGIGMGLPWPFMGAGLSFLPKPGMWMERVKQVFGVVIIAFALYYGHLAYSLFTSQLPANKSSVEKAQQESIKSGWLVSLPEALELARKEKKPLFIDFWASWCKNCITMEETTFKNEDVRKKLDNFVRVKFRAEHPDEPATRAIMEYFDCLGLPTYVVLLPVAE